MLRIRLALSLASALFCASPGLSQSTLLLPDNQQVELPLADGRVSGDADHATIAIGENGDLIAVWHVKDGSGSSQEIHAAYFKLYHQPAPHWIAGPPRVLARKDSKGRGCMKPDVIATYDESDPTNVAFVVTWGRRNKLFDLGTLEACVVLPPQGMFSSPEVVHTNGISGFVLDGQVDSDVARIAPDLVWFPGMGLGRAGVVYSSMVSDNGNVADVSVRWREFTLPVEPDPPTIISSTELVSSIQVFGEIYDLAGGKIVPDAQIVPSGEESLRLALAYEESVLGPLRDGSMIRVAAYDFWPGDEPALVFEHALLPVPSLNRRFLRRPNVAWNQVLNAGARIEVACYAVGDPKLLKQEGLAYTFDLTTGELYEHNWSSSAFSQNTPIPVALSNSRAVFFHNDGELGYVQQGPTSLRDGNFSLGNGRLPHVAWAENIRQGNDDLVAISSYAENTSLPGNPRRIRLQVLVDRL